MINTIDQDEINAILWRARDAFRGTVDPAEYKNHNLVMLFFKYISDVRHDHFGSSEKPAIRWLRREHVHRLLTYLLLEALRQRQHSIPPLTVGEPG